MAFPSEETIANGRAPLETYTVTAGEHGDIYRASDAYIAWLRSRVPGYGGIDRVSRAPSRASAQEIRGKEGGGTKSWINGRMQKDP